MCIGLRSSGPDWLLAAAGCGELSKKEEDDFDIDASVAGTQPLAFAAGRAEAIGASPFFGRMAAEPTGGAAGCLMRALGIHGAKVHKSETQVVPAPKGDDDAV